MLIFNRLSKMLPLKKFIHPIARKDLSHFFCAPKRKIPLLLDSFIGHDKCARDHYFSYANYFEKAKTTFEEKNYSLAIKYLEEARFELAETTDLVNLTMSLFGQMDTLEKQIQGEMLPEEKKLIYDIK